MDLRTIFFISMMLFSAGPAWSQQSLQWPLAVNYGISATFGEFRYGHFHAGIDLRTGGRNGFKVLAAESGTIYRLNVRKRGYGKAIYIRHEHDLITVYGHLERFEEQNLHLESFLAEKQLTRGKYPGNLYLNLPVKKGQCIAYSGESGAGLPHLHFETRQGEERPVNPFKVGFSLSDTKGPSIRRVIFTPQAADTYINNQPLPFVLSKAQLRKKTPLVIRGQIEVKVDAYDVAGALNKVNIYSASLKLADRVLNEFSFDTISYNQNHRCGLIYDLAASGFSPTRYVYQLGHRYSQEIPFGLSFGPQSGILETRSYEDGPSTIQIQVADYEGNRETISIPLLIANTPPTSQRAEIQNKERTQPCQFKHCQVRDYHNYLVISGQVARSTSRFPLVSVTVPETGHIQNQELFCPAANNFVGTVDLTTLPQGSLKILFNDPISGAQSRPPYTYVVRRFKATRGGRLQTEKFYLKIPPRALFEDLYLSYKEGKSPRQGALEAIGEAVFLRPVGVPFDQPVLIGVFYSLEQDQDPRKLGLYVRNEYNKRWSYVRPTQHIQATGLVEIALRSLAGFCLFYDDVPPIIKAPTSFKPASLRPGQIIILQVSDQGMGIDDTRTRVTIAAKNIDNEYDPDRGWLKIFLPLGIKKGEHPLSVIISDHGGNESKPFQSKIIVL